MIVLALSLVIYSYEAYAVTVGPDPIFCGGTWHDCLDGATCICCGDWRFMCLGGRTPSCKISSQNVLCLLPGEQHMTCEGNDFICRDDDCKCCGDRLFGCSGGQIVGCLQNGGLCLDPGVQIMTCNGEDKICPAGNDCICCPGSFGSCPDDFPDLSPACFPNGNFYCNLNVTQIGKGFRNIQFGNICPEEPIEEEIFGVLTQFSGGPHPFKELFTSISQCTRVLDPTTEFDVSTIQPIDIGIVPELAAFLYIRTLPAGSYTRTTEYHRARDNFRIARFTKTLEFPFSSIEIDPSVIGYLGCEVDEDGDYYVTWELNGFDKQGNPINYFDRIDFSVSGVGEPIKPITLTARPTNVGKNEEIEIIINACGNTGQGFNVGIIVLEYGRIANGIAKWEEFCICLPGRVDSCDMTSVNPCQNTWRVSEPNGGIYSYFGRVADFTPNNNLFWTTPQLTSVTVVNPPPSSTISADKTSIVLGETITFTITATDDQGVNQINFFDPDVGSWAFKLCPGNPTCTKSWTVKPTSPGTKGYRGAAFDSDILGALSTPDPLTVTVFPSCVNEPGTICCQTTP